MLKVSTITPAVRLQNVKDVWGLPATNPADRGQVRTVIEFIDGRLACTYPSHNGRQCAHVLRVHREIAREQRGEGR